MRTMVFITLAVLAAVSGQRSGAPGSDKEVVQREKIEWCDIWVTNADSDDLPRVLFIGDSITRGYFDGVEKHLAGKANCARVTTSKCIGDPGFLPEVELLLKQYRFAAIHVNNGMHGWSYTDEQYARAFEPFMQELIRQGRGARLIWAHTTPVMKDGALNPEQTDRVKARNRTAAAFASKHQIPVNDLFGLVVEHPEYFSPDGVHLSREGIAMQARQVAEYVERAMKE